MPDSDLPDSDPVPSTGRDRAALLDYVPAPESRALARTKDSYGLFIGGRWVASTDGSEMPTLDPATEETIATVAVAGPNDVTAAVTAARRAYEEVWGPMSGTERAKYLFRLARLVAERARELAVTETLDNGKPIRETRDVDVPLAAQHLFYHAGWADKLEAACANPHSLGVVGQVIPWNFPLLMAAWKIGPALACGNTVVLKPAETTPLTALILAEMAEEAGLPPGVLNVVTGAGETGAALVAHPGIDKVAFTGSTTVGRSIAAQVAGTHKRLTLELGGKGANIVYDTADLPRAVEGVVDGIFFNQGHVCCAGSRLLVQESISSEFLVLLRRRMELLRLGDPMDKNTDVGAINSASQLARITAIVERGVKAGAELWSPDCALPERGYWFAPTLARVETTSPIAREEVFGPVLAVLTFRTPEEAVAKANNTPYGLATGIWSERGSLAQWTAARVRTGVVWINTYNRFDPAAPFGGLKESGYGREGGIAGLRAYLV